jgi:hypothetical protein
LNGVDYGFRILWGHGSVFVLSVACRQVEVEVFATGRSLVQRSLTESGASECDLETSTMMRLRLNRVVQPWKKLI